MKKIFVIYGHYNNKSFTCAIKDTFIEEAGKNGHEIDIVDLYKDKFNPVFAGELADQTIKNYQSRIDKADVILDEFDESETDDFSNFESLDDIDFDTY